MITRLTRWVVTGLTVALCCGCQSSIAVAESRASDTMITLFANNPEYLARTEPEQTVAGYLYRVDIETGPNTRDLPIRLRTEQGDWGVYSEGISDQLMGQLMDRPISLKVKWIDQSADGFSVEVWIGSVSLQ